MTGLLANRLTGPLVVRNVPARTANRLAAAAVTRIFQPQAPPEGYLVHMRPELLLDPARLRANARQAAALKRQLRAMVPRYPDLAMPVEILHGTADAVVPHALHALPLARQIPGARLTTLEGMGHMPQHGALAEVVAALQRLSGA